MEYDFDSTSFDMNENTIILNVHNSAFLYKWITSNNIECVIHIYTNLNKKIINYALMEDPYINELNKNYLTKRNIKSDINIQFVSNDVFLICNSDVNVKFDGYPQKYNKNGLYQSIKNIPLNEVIEVLISKTGIKASFITFTNEDNMLFYKLKFG